MRKGLVYFLASVGFVVCLVVAGGYLFSLVAINKVFELQSASISARKTSGNIGLVPIEGPIFSSAEVRDRIEELVEDSDIQGILLRIDSPGGAVGPSQELYDLVLKTREKKKVVASMAGSAASGAYYIAAAADKIVANPGTLTGSIGVIMEFVNIQGLLQWAKIDQYNLKSGDLKDVGSPSRPMTAEERKFVQSLIDSVNSQFVSAIAKGRNLPEEQVRQVADGRIMTGEQALNYRLVDALGGQETAVQVLVELAGIKDKPQVAYPRPQRPEFIEYILDGVATRVTSGVKQLSLSQRWNLLLMPASIP